jgi:hypothetical protein
VSGRSLAALALACASVSAPTLAPVAAGAAAPKACVAITDDTSDVGPSGFVPDDHLDLVEVTVRATPATLVLTVRDSLLDTRRRGRWTVEFAVNGTRMYATANLGSWADISGTGGADGTVGFRAGLVGGPARGITGKFDWPASTLTMTVPYTTYGGALAPASLLRNVQAESRETFLVSPTAGAKATAVDLSDTGVRHRPLALSTCKG